MNKMLVAVFDNENNAFKGLSTLKDLHTDGDITLYASAVITKDEKGEFHINSAADQGPAGKTTRLLTGSLLGLLGGPVGLTVCAATGKLVGLIFDIGSNDVNSTFVEEVSKALVKGKTAVIAEIDEKWGVPVDTRLEALNAMVFRRLKYEIEEDQLIRESEAISEEFRNLKEELREANEEDKAAIKTAIKKLQNKGYAINDRLKRKLDESKQQFDAKVSCMKQQIKDARQKSKVKLVTRINEVEDEYRSRTGKLKRVNYFFGNANFPVDQLSAQ